MTAWRSALDVPSTNDVMSHTLHIYHGLATSFRPFSMMFEPTKTLPRIILNLFLVTFFLTINKKLWSYALQLFGHEIHIQSISLFPLALRGITYRYRSKTLSLDARVGSIQCRFQLPTPQYPQLLAIIIKDAFYKKGDLNATKSDETVVTVWFLPVFFRRTSSSLITVKTYGCAVDNVNVDEEAWWARAIRANITETVLQGETIRLHDLKTKLWLYEPVAPQTEAGNVDIGGESMGRTVGAEQTAEENEEDGEVLDNDPVKAREVLQEEGGEHNHEARARFHAIQWMLHNYRNERVYSFGSFNAEVRRPWGAPPYPAMPERVGVHEKVELPQGSMVLKITDSTWTKLPRVETDAEYFKSSTPSQLIRSILSFPGYVTRTFRDPMSIVDIEAKDVEITYREFRLRDAEMFKHALEAAKTAYGTQVPRFKQIVSDWTWALWCDAVTRALSND